MIVVDINIITYLYLPTEYTELAERLLQQDPDWVAPALWRSELRNVLAHYLREKLLTFDVGFTIQSEAEALLPERKSEPDSNGVLCLVEASDCSAYEYEFVALAKTLEMQLVTTDKTILKAFPGIAMFLSSVTHWCRGCGEK